MGPGRCEVIRSSEVTVRGEGGLEEGSLAVKVEVITSLSNKCERKRKRQRRRRRKEGRKEGRKKERKKESEKVKE